MHAEILAQLKSLNCHGMAAAWNEISADAVQLGAETTLQRLLQAETAERQARSLNYQLKTAKFPIHRDFTDFSWDDIALAQNHIEKLAGADFTETAQNLILVGGTGTGKTHIATALGVSAIHHGKRVRFFNVTDLVNQLQREKQLDKIGAIA